MVNRKETFNYTICTDEKLKIVAFFSRGEGEVLIQDALELKVLHICT